MKKMLEKAMVVCLVFALAGVLMGNKGCEQKQDVITILKVTQSTLDVVYNGTAVPLIEEYCKDLIEGDENFDVCKEFPEIDAATKEFLGTTFPSIIRIAEIVIPEGTEPSDGDNITKAYMQMYVKLPAEQQAAIREAILKQR